MKTKKKIETKDLENLKNQLARALADYDNLRKRVEEEKKLWITLSSQRILERLLPVLDNLEKALEHTKDQGLGIAVSEFKNLIKDEGIEEISPKPNGDFNHDLMEALDMVSTKDKNLDNKVESVIFSGWKFSDGPIIRHAKVRVYKISS